MNRFRLLRLAGLLISIQIVSVGCHRIVFSSEEFIFFVKETDKNQFVGFEAAPQPLRSWWQGIPKETIPEGRYIVNDGKETVSGTYWSEASTLVLGRPEANGQELRFLIEPDLSLRDESGIVWRRGATPHELPMQLKAYAKQN
jgi:hypothetical protein